MGGQSLLGHRQMLHEKSLDKMAEVLDLNEQQKNDIQTIFIRYHAKIDAMKILDNKEYGKRRVYMDWDDDFESEEEKEVIVIYGDNNKRDNRYKGAKKIKYLEQMNHLYKEVLEILTPEQQRKRTQLLTEQIEQSEFKYRTYMNSYLSVVMGRMDLNQKDKERLSKITGELLDKRADLRKESINPLSNISDHVNRYKKLYKNIMDKYSDILEKENMKRWQYHMEMLHSNTRKYAIPETPLGIIEWVGQTNRNNNSRQPKQKKKYQGKASS